MPLDWYEQQEAERKARREREAAEHERDRERDSMRRDAEEAERLADERLAEARGRERAAREDAEHEREALQSEIDALKQGVRIVWAKERASLPAEARVVVSTVILEVREQNGCWQCWGDPSLLGGLAALGAAVRDAFAERPGWFCDECETHVTGDRCPGCGGGV